MTTTVEWTIPKGLSKKGRDAAKLILVFLKENDLSDHGGGGKLYTPKEWKDRGEKYGTNSVLVITHDGGDHACAFNWDYERYALMDELKLRLDEMGLFVEQCTSWYSAIYLARG